MAITNEKSGCLCLRNSVLIYEPLWCNLPNLSQVLTAVIKVNILAPIIECVHLENEWGQMCMSTYDTQCKGAEFGPEMSFPE